jgi:hypothetical protein
LSQAGILSNRGDYYQILIATYWLARLLREPENIRWVEVEAVALPGSTELVTVDDIVVEFTTGHKRFIQIKKNQSDFRAWSLGDLQDELKKALQQWRKLPDAEIEFVSRTEFGDLRKLHEYSKIYSEYGVFTSMAPQGIKEVLAELAAKLEASTTSAFLLVSQLRFGPSHGFEEWERQNLSALAEFLPRPETAITVLQSLILKKHARAVATTGPFNRSDVLIDLENHGLVPAPKRSESEILQIFSQASAIGRPWHREIAGLRIPTAHTDTAIRAIEEGKRTVLLQGGPGSGKTCVLLDVAERAETNPNLGLLFIKADNFKNANSESDLSAGGLPGDIVGLCARMSEYRHVVVAIDSLDVLSLSRHHRSLGLFLGLIDRLAKLDGVSTVATCRKFDLAYDPQLRVRQWEEKIEVANLDFESQVIPLLAQLAIPHAAIPSKTRPLLLVPNILKLYVTLALSGIVAAVATPYEVFEVFIDELILKNDQIGVAGLKTLYRMATDQLSSRSSITPRAKFAASEALAPLLSLGVLAERRAGILEFEHQSWSEILSVRAAIVEGQTLRDFVKAHPPLPFIRPIVRAFFFYLRTKDPKSFSRQVRAVVNDPEIAYHLKRLIAESFSEFAPTPNDWGFIRELSDKHSDLFRRLLWRTRSAEWFLFLREHWLTHVQAREDSDELLMTFVSRLSDWTNDYPTEVVDLWMKAIREHWGTERHIRWQIIVSLADFKQWSAPGVRALLELLLGEHPNAERESLGKPISLFVSATNTGDDLLWSWIICDFKGPRRLRLDTTEDLHCQAHELCSASFLQERMANSEYLLNAALDSIAKWSQQLGEDYQSNQTLFNGLLHHTSWERDHTDFRAHHAGGIELLFIALENAIASHAKRNSTWWQQHRDSLFRSRELALRYIYIKSALLNIEYNIAGVSAMLIDRPLFENGELTHELGLLMNAAYPYLTPEVQDANQDILLTLHDVGDETERSWVLDKIAGLVGLIPAPYRGPAAQAISDTRRNRVQVIEQRPHMYLSGGVVAPPFTVQELICLSDKGVIKLLKHYDVCDGRDLSMDPLVGGKSQVLLQLQTAASLDPVRFSSLADDIYGNLIDLEFLFAVIGGLATHIRYRSGRLGGSHNWEPKTSPDPISIAQTILKWLEKFPRWIDQGYQALQGVIACSETLLDNEDADRLTILLFPAVRSESPTMDQAEKNREFIGQAINSVRGQAAQAALALSNSRLEAGLPLPELLPCLLNFFARDSNPIVRAILLHGLPYIILKLPDLGWSLFRTSLDPIDRRLWLYTERDLYHQYHDHYDRVAPWLERLEYESDDDAAEGWGRLVTLAFISGHLTWQTLITKLEKRASNKAWHGCCQVFVANLERRESTAVCQKGLLFMFSSPLTAHTAIELTDRMFFDARYPFISHEIARLYLKLNATKEEAHNLHGFLDWLAQAAREGPHETLETAESLVDLLEQNPQARQLWNKESLLPALTAILKEADESDDPSFIRRAIAVQDCLLKFDVHGIHEFYDMASEA